MKRYQIIIVSLILFAFVGCAQQGNLPEGFYRYDQSEVKALLNQLTFHPAIPSFLPIKAELIVTDQFNLEGTDNQAMDVSFYSKDNDVLTFQATEGKFQFPEKNEEVQIDKQTKGKYTDNQFAKSLFWTKDNVSYVMTFRPSMHDEQVSKRDLIKIAQQT